MEWARYYPDLGTVMRAPLQALEAWEKHLPAPQTDVERTIRRRLEKRLLELAATDFAEKHPEKAAELIASLERISDAVERLTGTRRPRC